MTREKEAGTCLCARVRVRAAAASAAAARVCWSLAKRPARRRSVVRGSIIHTHAHTHTFSHHHPLFIFEHPSLAPAARSELLNVIKSTPGDPALRLSAYPSLYPPHPSPPRLPPHALYLARALVTSLESLHARVNNRANPCTNRFARSTRRRFY